MPIGISHQTMQQMLGSLRSIGVHPGQQSPESRTPKPFITISRQAGSGGVPIGQLLAERLTAREALNAESIDIPPWQCFDRELVEKIARDHHLSKDLIESLERSSHTWIEEFLAGLGHTDKTPSELAVFRRVVQTMRALAQAGRVILVGFGGVMITRDMPSGFHLRIVAPLAWRVRSFARAHNIPDAEALKTVNLLDHDREAFVRRFWPGHPLSSESFHLTVNSALLTDDQIVNAIVPLVGALHPAAVG